jgi:hypothetical protein
MTPIIGYGLKAKDIRRFMKSVSIDPYKYDQFKDDKNDHKILDGVLKNKNLNYFSPTDNDDWILYQPAIRPAEEKQSINSTSQVERELIKVITELYDVPQKLTLPLTVFVVANAKDIEECLE